MSKREDQDHQDPMQVGIWYVAHLKPNGLAIAQTNLARQQYRTLMPMRDVSRHTARGIRISKKPLFPGYVFFSSPTPAVDWRAVSNTRGIARVITGTGGQPARLPADIAAGLLLATSDDGMLVPLEQFQQGDRVGVISGPFSGWIAEVIAADDSGRVQLLIDLMGRATCVSIASRDIEKSGS